jgi:uncharacterized lipoprotein YddW (UPF0748 family)
VAEEVVRKSLIAASIVAAAGCAQPAAPVVLRASTPVPSPEPPPAPRQFRAAWVATVANIDWPSLRGLSAQDQQTEIRGIVNRAASLGLNALILQVRPATDAIYPSQYEPWTEYLSGEQGRDPGYDPLAVWITAAHEQGLELHAWFNPYRARHKDAKSPLADNHVSKTHPEIVKSYGGYLWMDPGEPASADLTLKVILDVVHRYDVDGVHIDDYFYPYPEKDAEFPDAPSFTRYIWNGGTLSRPDFRRQNVSDLVHRINDGVHAEKPWVKFGVSPFGIGRPDRRPPGVTGFSQYDSLYADVETWLEKGWMDYLVPQLYWTRANPKRPFAALLDYWTRASTSGRPVWAGLNTSDMPWPEIEGQLAIATKGQAHFSMKALLHAPQLYEGAALVPASPWMSAPRADAPELVVSGAKAHCSAKNAARFAVWARRSGNWELQVVASELEIDPSVDAIVASSIDRVGNESARVRWSRAQ